MNKNGKGAWRMSKKAVFFVRLVAVILSLLMILSTILAACGSNVFALDLAHPFQFVDDATRYDTPDSLWTGEGILPLDEEPTIRVGLLYKYSSVNTLAFSQTISATKGLSFFTEIDGVRCPLGIAPSSASIVRNKPAKKDSSGNYVSSTSPTFLPYTLLTERSFSPYVIERAVRDISDALGGQTDVYPVAMDHALFIGVGQYASAADAEAALKNLQELTPFTYEVFAGDDSTVAALADGHVVAKAVTDQNKMMVYPIQPDYSNVQIYYTSVLLGNSYPGIFEYSATKDGIALTNVVDFEEYIKCVVPSEVYNTWPKECLKGFSIAVRSYALDKTRSTNHKSGGFHICPTAHCQVYKGRKNATPETDQAVEETRGMVLAYEDELIAAYYSSAHGGVSESAANTWGSDPKKYPYLSPVYMPQERYAEVGGLTWYYELSTSQLSSRLLDSSKVTGTLGNKSITKVEVLSYTDSGYVYKVKLTNSAGKSYTYTETSTIKSIFDVKSANFKLAHPTNLKMPNGDRIWSVNGKLYIAYLNVNSIYMLKPVADGDLSQNQLANCKVDTSTYGIFGQGYGHGVGLSQYCCRDLANLGWHYQEIALFFFPGSRIAAVEDFIQ